jgi:hypothetical protein
MAFQQIFFVMLAMVHFEDQHTHISQNFFKRRSRGGSHPKANWARNGSKIAEIWTTINIMWQHIEEVLVLDTPYQHFTWPEAYCNLFFRQFTDRLQSIVFHGPGMGFIETESQELIIQMVHAR